MAWDKVCPRCKVFGRHDAGLEHSICRACEETVDHLDKLSEAFVFVGVAVIQTKARAFIAQVGRHRLAWLSPLEVLGLTEALLKYTARTAPEGDGHG
jgi:hypothetical protein